MILNQLLNGIRRWLGPMPSLAPVAVSAPVLAVPPRAVAVRQLAAPAPGAADSRKRGRPISDSLARTLEVLAANPEISPADLASRLRLSPSYARTLLRRARNRVPEPAAKPARTTRGSNTISMQPVSMQPVSMQSVSIQPVSIQQVSIQQVEPSPRTAQPVPAPDDPLPGLAERLHQAEVEIRQLRTARPATRVSWDVQRRAEVLRRSLAGESAQYIAADLRIPSGEVAFILKVHQILAAAN